MADGSGIADLWRRALDVNVRYYDAYGKLATEWLRELAATMSDLRLPLRLPTLVTDPVPTRPATSAPSPPTPRPPPTASSPALLLEGDAGHEAVGVFLVDNGLPHPVEAPVTATPFVDERGVTADVALRFDPMVVALLPGEQVLVRVTATIPPDAEPDVGYRSELSIPGLPGTRVVLVLRRRPPVTPPEAPG